MVATKTIKVTTGDGGSFDAYLAIPNAGHGPGLVILQEIFGVNETLRDVVRHFAEQGYVTVAPDLFWRLEPNVSLGYSESDVQKAFGLYQRFDTALAIQDIVATGRALAAQPECRGEIGVLGFCLGGTLAVLAAAEPVFRASVAYYPVGLQDMPTLPKVQCPTVIHFGGQDHLCPPEATAKIQAGFSANPHVKTYVYPNAGHAFFNKDRPEYNKSASGISLTRSLAVLRGELGPDYDLSALWDQHTMHEFVSRNAADTIETMVDEPYVNHVPTLTGGVGKKELYHFYKNYFVDVNDESLTFTPVSRTVGVDRVVDELVVSFRHTKMMDYLLPGVPPTGKDVKFAMVSIVSFRGDKIYHEHIYWDHASLLAQVGLLDPAKLPISGAEQADKVLDPASVPSNAMMTTWKAP
jgi:carboxymethylenebutenolidase